MRSIKEEIEVARLFKKALDAGNVTKEDIHVLSGNMSLEALEIKNDIARDMIARKNEAMQRGVAESLTGDPYFEAKATNLGHVFVIEHIKHKDFRARTYAGPKYEQEYALLKEWASEGIALDPILRGLAEDDSEKAWEIRDMMAVRARKGEEWPVLGSLFQSLAGLDSERAWQMRDELKYLRPITRPPIRNHAEISPAMRKDEDISFLAGHLLVIAFAHSLQFLDSKRASKERREIMKKINDSPVKREALTVSITGLETNEAKKIRKSVLQENSDPYFMDLLVKSLAGCSKRYASGMRTKLRHLTSTKAFLASFSKSFVLYHKPL